MSTRGHLSRQSVLMRLQPHLVLDPSRCICLFTKAKLSPCPPRPFETPPPPTKPLGTREMKNALKVNCFSFRHTRPTTLLVVVVVVVPFVVTRLVLFLYHEEDERRSFFTNFTQKCHSALRDSFEGFFLCERQEGELIKRERFFHLSII